MKPGFKMAKCADFVRTQLWQKLASDRWPGVEALCGNVVISCYTPSRWRSPCRGYCYVKWLVIVIRWRPCTVLYCTALYCTVLACYRNKVKPAVKMSDDVNCAVLSPVTPPLWVQQGRLSCKNQQKPGTKITRLQAPASSGQGWHQPEQILQCMIMEEPSDSWILTTEQHTTAAGSRCSAEVSAGKMGSPHSSTEPL